MMKYNQLTEQREFLFLNYLTITEIILPITTVSSGISSIKHFLSVSDIWKYNAEENDAHKAINKRTSGMSL